MSENIWDKISQDILDIYNDTVDMEYKFSRCHEVDYFINNGEPKAKGEIAEYLKHAIDVLFDEKLKEVCSTCVRSDEVIDRSTRKGSHRGILPKGH